MPDRLRTSTQIRQAIYQQVAEADHPLTREEIVDELDELVDGEYPQRCLDTFGQSVYAPGQYVPWFG